MADSKETIHLDAVETVTTATDRIAAGLHEVAGAQDLVIKGTANLNKELTAYNQFSGVIRQTTKDGIVFSQKFKIAKETLKNFSGSTAELQKHLKIVGGSLKIDTQATARLAREQEKAAEATRKQTIATSKETSEFKRQYQAQLKLLQLSKQRRTVRPARAGRATQKERLDVSAAEDQLRKLLRTVKVTENKLDKVFKDLSRGAIVDYGVEINRVRNGAIKLLNAERQLGRTAEIAHNKAAKAAEKQRASLAKTATASQTLIKNLGGLARVGGISLFIGALFRLQQAFEDGVLLAGELTKKIAEIETIQGEAVRGTAIWTKDLKNLSNAFGIDILDQAEAAYQTLSNQVAKGAAVTSFLVTANKLAAAGVAETSESVNLLTSVINAYNKDIEEAANISGKLFKTVELGRVRIGEMSESFGKILVPAQSIGVRFEELAAAVATTTIRGVKFNEASTLIRGVLQKLIKPTEKMKDFLAELGFNSGEAAIQTLGLGKFLAELDKKTRGSSSELGNLFNRIRAVTGGLIFAGEGLEDFNRNLAQIDAAGVEDLEKASGKVLETLGKRFDRTINEIKNYFLVDLGPPTLKILLNIYDAFKKAAKGVSDFGKTIRANIAIMAVLETAFLTLAAAITIKLLPSILIMLANFSYYILVTVPQLIARNLAAAASFLALHPVIVAVAVALVAFKVAWDATQASIQAVKNEADDFTASIEAQAQAILKNRKELEKLDAALILKGLKERNQAIRESVAEENAILFAAQKQRLAGIKELRRQTDANQKATIKGFKSIASAGKAAFDKLAKKVDGTTKDIRKAFLAATKNLFDFDLGVSVDRTQLALIDNQITRLRDAQEQAAVAGDKRTFDRVSAQIKALSKKRFSVTQRLAKAQQKADRDVFEARAEIIRAEATGDKQKIQTAKDTLKDAKKAQGLVGVQRTEELNITKEIAEVRRKLSRAAFRSPEALALKKELDGLRKLQLSLNDGVKQEQAHRRSILTDFEKEQALRLKLQDQLAAKAKVIFKEQLKARLLAEELVSLDKQRRDFNLEKVLETGDPEEVKKALEKQEGVYKRIFELQEKSGVEAAGRGKLEDELFLLRKTTLDKVAVLENNLFTQELANAEKLFQTRLNNARKLGEEQSKEDSVRLARLQAGLAKIAERVGGINVFDFGKIAGGDPDALKENRADQRELIKVFTDLSANIGKEIETPGSVPNLGKQLEKAFTLIQTQGARGDKAGIERLQGDVKLQRLAGNIEDLGRQFTDNLGRLNASLSIAQERFEAGEGSYTEIARLTSLIEDEQRRLNAGIGERKKGVLELIKERDARQQQIKDLKSNFAIELKAIKERVLKLKSLSQNEEDYAEAIIAATEVISDVQEKVAAIETKRRERGEARAKLETERQTTKTTVEVGADVGETLKRDRQSAEEAAKDQVRKNHEEGAKAQRPIVVETAKQAAIEGVKAKMSAEEKLIAAKKKADAETQAAAEKLRKQKEQQEKIRKAVGGLSGYAKRVALSDLETGTSGVAQRKKEAEARRDQRKRNEDFLRQRREAKAAELGKPLTPIGGPADISNEIKQLSDQVAKKLAEQVHRVEGPAKIEEAGKLTTLLADLLEIQARAKGPETPEQKLGAQITKVPALNESLVKNTDVLVLLTAALDENSAALKQRYGPLDLGKEFQPFGYQYEEGPSQILPIPPKALDLATIEDKPIDLTLTVKGDVQMDGAKVGTIVTPTVKKILGRDARRRVR